MMFCVALRNRAQITEFNKQLCQIAVWIANNIIWMENNSKNPLKIDSYLVWR